MDNCVTIWHHARQSCPEAGKRTGMGIKATGNTEAGQTRQGQGGAQTAQESGGAGMMGFTDDEINEAVHAARTALSEWRTGLKREINRQSDGNGGE
jgi:hypothetical protein